MPDSRITSPDDPALDDLCRRLAELAPGLEQPGAWPADQLKLCGEAGVFEWFIEPELGGQGWSEADVLRGYVKLTAACLTTTFVITQRTGAMSRIAATQNEELRNELLPDLIRGRTFATVGISHLTTSRQHLAEPSLRAAERETTIMLDGSSPWVTGAEFAQYVVLGATLGDRRQLLLALPTDMPGVRIERSPELVGLSASRTGPVRCDVIRVPRKWLLAGPAVDVMKQGTGAKTGGLQTSALAIGLSNAAIRFLRDQSSRRENLLQPLEALERERDELFARMLTIAEQGEFPSQGGTASGPGMAEPTIPATVRQRANSLALRASQAALAAAKGAGYVAGHPAGRWCREALFFLVWSCPQPVLQANLCELAGIAYDQ